MLYRGRQSGESAGDEWGVFGGDGKMAGWDTDNEYQLTNIENTYEYTSYSPGVAKRILVYS